MPRRARGDEAGVIYHVLNRSVRRATIFYTEDDYTTFERVLLQALQRVPIRLLAYCAMPNHWHLIVWTTEPKQLRRFMHWLTCTHAQRWHAKHGTSGTGPLYQGRYKSIPIGDDRRFFTVCRYVERNALAAALVSRAEEWQWASLWRRCNNSHEGVLHDWPVPVPPDWVTIVNRE
jgi:putative transposase